MLLTATFKKEKKLLQSCRKKKPIVNICLQENEDILKYLKSFFLLPIVQNPKFEDFEKHFITTEITLMFLTVKHLQGLS